MACRLRDALARTTVAVSAGVRNVTSDAGRGQTLVEFALVVTIFLTLLMGIIDFGRGVMAYNSISHAAREGARSALYALEVTNDFTQVEDIVLAQATMAPGLTRDGITVTPVTPRRPGTIVTVTVTYTFEPITPMMRAFTGTGLVLRASAQGVVQ